jgi:hypothetical protein
MGLSLITRIDLASVCPFQDDHNSLLLIGVKRYTCLGRGLSLSACSRVPQGLELCANCAVCFREAVILPLCVQTRRRLNYFFYCPLGDTTKSFVSRSVAVYALHPSLVPGRAVNVKTDDVASVGSSFDSDGTGTAVFVARVSCFIAHLTHDNAMVEVIAAYLTSHTAQKTKLIFERPDGSNTL